MGQVIHQRIHDQGAPKVFPSIWAVSVPGQRPAHSQPVAKRVITSFAVMTRGCMPISTTPTGGLLRRQANDEVVRFDREIKFRRGHCAKSGKACDRTMRQRCSMKLLVQLPLMRNCSANFKGGDITIVNRSPVRAFVGPAPEPSSKEERRCCLNPGIFRSYGSGVPGLFHFGEPEWLRP